MNSRTGTVLLALVATGVSLGVGLGVLEWFVRYREAHRTEVPGTMPFLFYPSYRLGYALVRDNDYYGWVHVNRQGFRGDDITQEPAAGVTRVMVVGASTTLDVLVGQDEFAWPARLEHWLNELGGGRRFEVINAGVPGYRAVDNVIRLQIELHRYRPSAIVFYPAHNDLMGALATAGDTTQPETRRPDEVEAVAPWTRWLERHSLLYNKLLLRGQAVTSRARGGQRQGSLDPAAFDRAIERGAVNFARDLKAFLALSAIDGIPVVLPQWVRLGGARLDAPDSTAISAAWRASVAVAAPDVLARGYARFDAVTREVATTSGAGYIETDGFGIHDLSLYAEGDPVHFSQAGAETMGRRTAEALLKLAPWEIRPAAVPTGRAPGR